MTQDEIIEMARQAGAAVGKPTPDGPNIVVTQCLDIYAFAKLVAAKEREACADLCDTFYDEMWEEYAEAGNELAEIIRARGEK